MQITAATGQPGKIVDGNTNAPVRMGNLGDLVSSNLHGRYYEQSYRGNCFALANQAPVTTTVGLATTFTGLALSNAAGSGVNAVLLGFGFTFQAVGVAASVGIMTGSGAAAGALVPRNRIVGGPTGRVTGSNSATIATPVLEATYGQIGSVATTSWQPSAGIFVDLGGQLIIPPGSFVASYTSAAVTSSLIFNFLWEEVPI